MKKFILIWMIGLFVLALPSISAEQSCIYFPSGTQVKADTFIDAFEPDTNNNADTSLQIRTDVTNTNTQRPIFTLHLTNLTNKTITNWNISFDITLVQATFDWAFHEVFANVSYSTVTWNTGNPCGTSLTVIGGNCNSTKFTSKSVAATGRYVISFNITTGIQQAAARGQNNFTFIIHRDAGDANVVDLLSTIDSAGNEPTSGGCFDEVSAPPPSIINNTSPIINISYPINGSTLDNSTFKVMINGTVTVQNGTIQNITINNTNFRNVGNQTFFNFTFNSTNLVNQRYDILLNATSQYGNFTTAIISFTVDTSGPSITATTLSGNHSLFYLYQNITFQINYSDNIKLFHINISTGSYSFEITNINQTSYIYNGSVNASTFGIGRQDLNTSFCDAHTSNRIDEWKTKRTDAKKEIRFDFGGDYFLVKPKDATLINSYVETKKEDRYIFSYTKNPFNKQNKQSFVVSSSQKIEIIGNDGGYYGWLVIPKLKKWVDFNLQDGSVPNYQITRIDNNNVLVEVDGITRDTFSFNSAGDLNCGSKIYSYYLFNYTASYSSSATESITENIKLIIDFKDISLKGNGTLNYNSVDYNTTNTTSSNQINLTIDLTIPSPPQNNSNLTFYWDFVLNVSTFTTINFSQLVSKVILFSCETDADLRVLNISIFNENLPSQFLESDVAAVFTTWTNNSGNTLNFSFDFTGDTNYSVCLSPNTSINTDAYFQYNTSGGFKQRWYLTDARFTTNISKLYLFNFDSTVGMSVLQGTIKDKNFAIFPLVTTKLQRYYPTENVWRTIQMDRSDEFGTILFNIIETTTDYRLIFEQGGLTISNTNPSKFKCTSSLCSLTFVVSSSSTSNTATPKFNTAFNNRSRMYQLNFSDSTGLTSSVRLKVTKEQRGDIITICDQTVTASDGTINCNLTGYDGTLTAKVFSSASPEIAKLVEYISIIANKLLQKTTTYITTNELTFWAMTLSTTLVVAGAIFNPIAGIILYIFSLMGIYALGIVGFVTVGFITLMGALSVMVGLLISKGRG